MAARVTTALSSLFLLALSGCATSNAAWLSEPETGMALGPELSKPFEHPRSAASAPGQANGEPALTAAHDAEAPRPRLARTVTLGGVAADERPAPAASGAPGAPVQVTVNNYVTAPGYAPLYEGPVYWPSPGRPGDGDARPRPRPSAPIIPGQDFPAPPAYGPPFPYKTAPASPWR
jgi:hypothetical protein